MYCPQCGKWNEPDARWCGWCGTPLMPGDDDPTWTMNMENCPEYYQKDPAASGSGSSGSYLFTDLSSSPYPSDGSDPYNAQNLSGSYSEPSFYQPYPDFYPPDENSDPGYSEPYSFTSFPEPGQRPDPQTVACPPADGQMVPEQEFLQPPEPADTFRSSAAQEDYGKNQLEQPYEKRGFFSGRGLRVILICALILAGLSGAYLWTSQESRQDSARYRAGYTLERYRQPGQEKTGSSIQPNETFEIVETENRDSILWGKTDKGLWVMLADDSGSFAAPENKVGFDLIADGRKYKANQTVTVYPLPDETMVPARTILSEAIVTIHKQSGLTHEPVWGQLSDGGWVVMIKDPEVFFSLVSQN